MKLFGNISVQTRLNLLVSLLAVIAAWNALSGLNQAADFQYQLAQLERRVQNLQSIAAARSNLLAEQVAVKNALLDPEYALDYTGVAMRRANELDIYLYNQGLNVEDEDQQASYEALDQSLTVYHNQLEQMFNALDDPEQAASLSVNQADESAAQAEAQLGEQAAAELDALRENTQDIGASVQDSAWSGQIALLLLTALTLWGVYTTVNISGPLQSLTNAIVAFENNTYRRQLVEKFLDRKDELGQLSRAVDGMATSITAANQLKERFLKAASRFIPGQYLEFLEKPDLTQVNLGDHVSAEMAVMFSDIRGFTGMSEKMTAKQNFDFVNEYLKLVSPLIQAHEGFIVKFLGDGMMAIFPYGVDDAVKAGIDKQKMVKEFNQILKERGYPAITVGIGIHTGAMMVGMIGEELRMQGDAFSDNVNLTSRVEGLNKFFGTSMIITQDTLNQLPKPITFRMRYLGKSVVKGRLAPLGLYEIYEGLPQEVAARKDAGKADFERGIALFAQGDFRTAGAAFDAVLKIDAEDKTARYYLERCAEQYGRALPAGWDGAIIMDAK